MADLLELTRRAPVNYAFMTGMPAVPYPVVEVVVFDVLVALVELVELVFELIYFVLVRTPNLGVKPATPNV